MAEKQKRVLRAPEAANYTGLSESTLAKRRLYGQPPAFLNLGGRAIGYAIDDLDAWLESCRRQSTSQQIRQQEAVECLPPLRGIE
jgi:predicted DNA-binding transcriptional regulator AlpA